jgi:hypothetical protein
VTRLDSRKSRLVFTTSDTIRERGKLREIVLEPSPRYVTIRLKGCRQRLVLEYSAIYHLAAKKQADQNLREAKEARKARKGIKP